MSDVDNPTNSESPTPQLDALTQAAQLVALGRSIDALSLLERLIEQDPASPQLYFLRAQATQQAGHLIREGLLAKTPRGRKLTEKALGLLGKRAAGLPFS